MSDRVTANLPARDMDKTAAFYEALGFTAGFKDEGWMILRRGTPGVDGRYFRYSSAHPTAFPFR